MVQPDQRHWTRTPLMIRNSQTALLLVSFTWGLSYVMPSNLRIAFSEVFPPDLTRWSYIPMWGYGAIMLGGAVFALLGEHIILTSPRQSRFGWLVSFLAHTALVGTYWTLAVGAVAQGLPESHWTAAGLFSALSRPVLWWFIGYLHLGFATLPQPAFPPRKKRRRRRLRFVEVSDG